MLIDWLIFASLCLLLFFNVITYVYESIVETKEKEYIEQMKQEYENSVKSEVKSAAGLMGVQAKDVRKAQKIANNVAFRINAPLLDLVSQYILPEEMEALKSNPMGFQVLTEILEPMIQEKIKPLLEKASNIKEPSINEQSNWR